jgi:hypothetical protein
MPKAKYLMPSDVKVLRFMRDYPGCVDFGGAGASAASRNAAKRMLDRGFLVGPDYRAVKALTPAGKNALNRWEGRERTRKVVAFRRANDKLEGGQ